MATTNLRHRVFVDDRGRITLPETMRKKEQITKGTVMELEEYKKDVYILRILVR